jgi:hypothetical protein
MKKTRIYLANSVWVDCPKEHASSNGGKQFTVLCRTTSKKRMAWILGCSLHHLTNFAGAHEVTHEQHTSIVEKDETVYYHVTHAASGWINKWFEWRRPDWLNKRDPL